MPQSDAELAQAFDMTALTPEFAQDPFPTYRALLAHAPVKRFSDGSVMVARHADLMRIYRDTTTFSSDKKAEFAPKFGDTPLYEHHTNSLVFNDPPLHTRVRRIMSGALTPRAIAAMEPALLALVDGLLDGLPDPCDLITDYASAIPVEVIGNLFDMPHAERGPLREWSLAILGALEPVLTQAQQDRGNLAVSEFSVYLKDLIARRRKTPGDPETDVLTRLMQGDRGDHLTEVELVQNCIFILNAGHETTTNLIGNGLDLLLEYPDQRALLLEQPDLIDSAVEENPAAPELEPVGKPDHDGGLRDRRIEAGGRHPGSPDHGGGEPRSGAVCRPGPVRHRPRAEPASGIRRGRACLPGPDAGAAGGPHRDPAFPGTVPGVPAERRGGAYRTGPVQGFLAPAGAAAVAP